MREKNKSGFDEMQVNKRHEIGFLMYKHTMVGIMLCLALDVMVERANLLMMTMAVCAISYVVYNVWLVKSNVLVPNNYVKTSPVSLIIAGAVIAATILLHFFGEERTATGVHAVAFALMAGVSVFTKEVAVRIAGRKKMDDD